MERSPKTVPVKSIHNESRSYEIEIAKEMTTANVSEPSTSGEDDDDL